MTPFKKVSEEEIQRINRLQRNTFDRLYHLFDPPLPEGVPERLEKIVAHGKIQKDDTVLDVGSGTGILIPIITKYDPGFTSVVSDSYWTSSAAESGESDNDRGSESLRLDGPEECEENENNMTMVILDFLDGHTSHDMRKYEYYVWPVSGQLKPNFL
jgi:hypothetical protein